MLRLALRPPALLTHMAPLLAACSLALAQQRTDVVFEISQPTTVGQSVYVLGSLPELGGGLVTRAVKLEPSAYPRWRATISLPAARPYSYQFLLRADAPAQQRITTNGAFVGTPLNGVVPGDHAGPKSVLARTTLAAPSLVWRQDADAFVTTPMIEFGAGRTGSERLWAMPRVGQRGRAIEFYFQSGSTREPSSGTYSVTLDHFVMQDGQAYSYTPAATVAPQRRDYTPSNPPSINSVNLSGEVRRYRVLLPRGYDQHPTRRYPVIYMHDGQNIFESGPFGTWNADIAAANAVTTGAMRECIIVGVENTSNRLVDYLPPQDGGRGDRYAAFLTQELKPLIESRYRTLTGAQNTATIGSSMGAVISLYLGWENPSTWGRLGLLSGAWQTTAIDARASTDSSRPLRIWIDSGDSGTSNDNYWLSYNLRDALVSPAHPGGAFGVGGTLQHVIGFNQQHNEAAWAARIGPTFAFLLPGSDEQSPLSPLAGPSWFDLDSDGLDTIGDLYAQHSPGTVKDINLDGQITEHDTKALAAWLRRSEQLEMRAGRQ